jgi:hypothetical protein
MDLVAAPGPMTREETFLHECWTLYFHDPDCSEWHEKSYHALQTVSAVEDWVGIDTAFKDLWPNGMFFLMREHILPMWEDPHNEKGGCISFKVNKPEAPEYWFQLGARTLGEVLSKNPDASAHVCGISISPKRNFCILRVWLSQACAPDAFHLECPHYSQVLYKPHTEQKDYDAARH